MNSGQERANDQAQTSERPEESRQQPLWHVLVLTALTLSAYSLVWFFKNWNLMIAFAKSEPDEAQLTKQQKTRLKSLATTNPWMWMLFLVLPGIQVTAIARFFSDVACLYPKEVPFIKLHPLAFGIGMTAVAAGLFCLFELPGPYKLFFLTVGLPFAFGQYMLNEFWKEVEKPGLTVRQAFSVGELVAIIFGSMLLGLIVTGFAMGIK